MRTGISLQLRVQPACPVDPDASRLDATGHAILCVSIEEVTPWVAHGMGNWKRGLLNITPA